MSQQNEINIDQLTTKAESGDARFVQQVINEVPDIEDRIKIIQQMDATNEKNRENANGALPDLVVDVGSYSDSEILLSVTRKFGAAGNKESIFSQRANFKETLLTGRDSELPVNLEELTRRAEAGDSRYVKSVFASIPQVEQRVQLALAMDDANFKHRKDPENKSPIPDLEVQTGTYSEAEIRINMNLMTGSAGNRQPLLCEMTDFRNHSRTVLK